MPVSKYELLIRLAAEKCDDAAHAMNAARQRMETARQRLQQLAQFLADYLHRRIARGEQGMSSGQWVDYQQFIERLQEAIDLQRREVDSSQTAYDKATAAWQEARKKLKALEKLQEQEKLRARLREAKREQKQTDEFAARIFRESRSRI